MGADYKTMKFPVMEMFRSIQGEGTFMGRKVLFIRLSGCNLACPWCDTKESWNSANAKLMSIEQIVAQVVPEETVTITGGEPTIHKDLGYLVERLHQIDCFVTIETNGINLVPNNFNWITCSPKPPGYTIHPFLNPHELKYVVTKEFNPLEHISYELRNMYNGLIWLQPDGTNFETMQDSWKRIYKMVMRDSCFRAGIQLHKIMEVQ